MPHALLPDDPGAPGHVFDELRDADGRVRGHWRALVDGWRDATPAQWRDWRAQAARRIRDNGVTYNVYADPEGADRPWPLDIVPLVLPATEWAHIAHAVAQRATLLDRVLADLYGPQQLLAEKSLPPALVYGHHGFLWPCVGTTPPGGRFLHVYAADIARAHDGRWWVLADRTQAPSGAGYALENRQIVSRLFPDACRDLGVQQPWDSLRALQEFLAANAPVDADDLPLVVLLTPGPLNETYFEHVYLARQLGFPLVEGRDLTVRGDTLFLKTLDGLRRVHAVLRRLDDEWCDPLDLRAESALGVAGLVAVARAGRVLVANALGSGVLESPGLAGFLPPLCERLLGEKLAMPSLATWWCGEAAAREYVEEHLARLVLKPAYPSQRMDVVFGNRLDAAGRAAWIERIRARPNAYVAQELMQLSRAPVLASDVAAAASPLAMRAVGLRVFAVATADGYRVMPGGLARVAGDTSLDVVSMQRGGSSKDTWVPGDAPVPAATALHLPVSARDISRAGNALPSRAAENLFWLGRYIERLAGHARLLSLAFERLVDEGEPAGGAVATLAGLGERVALVPAGVGGATAPRLLNALFDPRWPGSIVDNIARAGRAGAAARERLSADHWQALERVQDVARRAATVTPRVASALPLLERLLLACTSLMGHAMDDMVRDAGWRFLVAGRRLERVQFLATAGAHALAVPDASLAAALLVDIADCRDTWRQRYQVAPELLPVLDIVLLDPDNPRALAFQGEKLARTLEKFAQQFGDAPDGGFVAALAGVRAFTLPTLEAAANRDVAAADLARRLDALHDASAQLSGALGHRFFTHVGSAAPRHVAV